MHLVEVEVLGLVHVLQMAGARLQLPHILDVEPLVVDHHPLGLFALASSSSANTALLWVLRLRLSRLGACFVVVVFVAGAVRVLVVLLHLGHRQLVLGFARLASWAAPASARRNVDALVRFALAHAPLARSDPGGWWVAVEKIP